MVDWSQLLKNSNEFKKAKPFKFGFIENIFDKEFYEKLYDTYPNFSEFQDGSDLSRTQAVLQWGNTGRKVIEKGEDVNRSKEWNLLKNYAESEEFVSKFRDFSGVPVNKLKHFKFIAYKKGGFQLPHIHNVGPSTLVMMFYFSKGWNSGDPGGTYLADDVEESSIIFEPYNLDNTVALFHDGPNAAHGTRLIEKNVERRALQITLEEYDDNTGWTGGNY